MNGWFRSWFLGGANGILALRFGGGNGTSKTIVGNTIDSYVHGPPSTTNGPTTSNYDGEGTYLIFNVRDTLLISDLYSHDKVCHLQHISLHFTYRKDNNHRIWTFSSFL